MTPLAETRTASSFVTEALKEIGAFDKTNPPTADELQTGLKKLNAMLAAWQNEQLLIPTFTEESFVTNPAANQYTIGPAGTFDTTRPMVVTQVVLRDSAGTDRNIKIVTRAEFNNIPDKNISGFPFFVFYDDQFPLGLIRINPTPKATDTLIITSKKPFTKFVNLTSVGVFPEECIEAIEYNLALRLNPRLTHLPVNPDLKDLAISAIQNFKSSNQEVPKMRYDGPGSRRSGRPFNANNGVF